MSLDDWVKNDWLKIHRENLQEISGLFSIVERIFQTLFLAILIFWTHPSFGDDMRILSVGDSISGEIQLYLMAEGELEKQVGKLIYDNCVIKELLTEKSFRGRGYATILMNTALEYLESCDSISLFAVPLDDSPCLTDLVKFYQRFGFKESKTSGYYYGKWLMKNSREIQAKL